MRTNGGGGPSAFWEREQGSTLGAAPSWRGADPNRSAPSAPVPALGRSGPPREAVPRHPGPFSPEPAPDPAFAPGPPRPGAPPARVGGAAAALTVAVLSSAGPVLMAFLGFWFFLLAVNLPGLYFGVTALRAVPDAERVEQRIRYTWACNFSYFALFVVFMVPVMILFLMVLMFTA